MSWRKIVVLLVGLVVVVGLVPVGAGAASHYFSQTRLVQVGFRNTAGQAACPHGWHVTGGGVKNDSNPAFRSINVESSYPYVNSTTHTQGWRVVVQNYSSQVKPHITVFAVCAS